FVKGGKKASLNTSGQEIAKLADSDTDQFDDWSKTRGQTLARANARLSARLVNGYLADSFSSSGFSRSGFSRSGFWTWSPFSSCFTFLPFSGGWGTPYGGTYGPFWYGGNSLYGGYNGRSYNPYYPPPIITG